MAAHKCSAMCLAYFTVDRDSPIYRAGHGRPEGALRVCLAWAKHEQSMDTESGLREAGDLSVAGIWMSFGRPVVTVSPCETGDGLAMRNMRRH